MRPASPSLRFSHLLVKNWRNFVKAEAAFGGRTFLTGPSGAGKSNFLDVFRFVSDLASPGAGFQEAVRRRGGVRRMRCLAARQESDLYLAIHAGDEGKPALWEYELHFNQEGHRLPLVKRERLARSGEEVVDRPDANDQSDPELLQQTALEPGCVRREARDFAAFLRTVRYVHHAPVLLRDPDQSPAGRLEPYGAGFLGQVASTLERSRQARLRLILETLAEAVPKLRQLESYRDAHGRPHLRALHEHWRPRGAWQDEDQLPDGTLRLIALFWNVLDGCGPLLVEEPETSLHPQTVRLVPEMLARLARSSGRQLILATHSLDLLRGQGVGTEEILLLNPAEEGSIVRPALDLSEATDLLDRGALAPDAGPAPPSPDRQMGLF